VGWVDMPRFATLKCSKCGGEADIFCKSCRDWHCDLCYDRELRNIWRCVF